MSPSSSAPEPAVAPGLSIDAGQSGMRLRLRADDGSARELALPGIRTDRDVPAQIADAARLAAAEWNVPIPALSAGVSGLTDEADAGALLASVADLGVRSVALAHDSVTGYLAALGLREGAMLAVGTGVVTLGVGPRGVTRVDGWGYLLGDAGSGFWIGRAGLDAAMRAFDGRGAETALLDDLRAMFGDPPSAYMRIQADEGRVGSVGSFARRVGARADEGDAVAIDIITAAARELALAASAALERTGWTREQQPPVSGVGGVLAGNALLRRLFAERVREEWPAAEVTQATAEPLDGVELLTGLPDEHPVATVVLRAGIRA